MKFVITGGDGMLALAFGRTAAEQGHEAVVARFHDLDVTDASAADAFIASARPDAVLHCAAYAQVDDAESAEAKAFLVNADGAANVARAAARVGAWMVYPSTDYVFAGTLDRPYRPDDATGPINAYGRSKLAGEEATRETAERHIIVRTSWLYGSGGRNFVARILGRARTGQPLRVVNDQHGSPTWTRDFARAVLALLDVNAPAGTYHVCNRGATTWYDFACSALQLAGVSTDVTAVDSGEFPRPARRPAYSVLDCTATDAVIGPQREWRVALVDALAEGI
jgi:dTDP-4-dehydrorhamnose reductase